MSTTPSFSPVTTVMMLGICRLLALGLSYQEIAGHLHVRREDIAPAVKHWLDYQEIQQEITAL